MAKLKVRDVRTQKSMYDGDCVNIEIKKDVWVRLHVDEIKKVLNETDRKFKLNKKKVHTYLEFED